MRKSILIPLLIVIVLVAVVLISNLFLFPIKYRDTVSKYADMYNLDIVLIHSVINVESGYDKDSVSSAGAVGLMQILPSTANDIAHRINIDTYDLKDIDTNIHFGCYYLRYLLDMYDNNLTYALMAYNAGLGTVNEWISEGYTLENIPYDETKTYIKRIDFNQKIYSIRL